MWPGGSAKSRSGPIRSRGSPKAISTWPPRWTGRSSPWGTHRPRRKCSLMKELAVAFLWHLHQPYYTDPLTKTAPLPWVRLHAIKGYFDMGLLLDEHPDVRVTMNLTPSLLLQLLELADGSVADLFWTHTARPAVDLTGDERVFILRHFFSANWDTMVRPHDRYYGLLFQRGTHPRDEDLPDLARRFSTQDLLDLQVWHNLAWFGHRALAQYPVLRELTAKGRQFTESDKQAVLASQRDIVARIIPLYRRLQDRGQIELSTTPFFHPILPLLIDTDSARRSRPDSAVPQRFAHPEDAETPRRKALRFHEGLFGRRLKAVAQRAPGTRPVVPVILDGENPWEHYPDGGEGFLRGLYAALTSDGSDGVRFLTVTPARELAEHPPTATLARLHTGSWINADLKIWVGHIEDNDAWERLGATRRFLQQRERAGDMPPDAVRQAWDELYAAEGSDWFWWYGDEFDTDHKALFDHLFRLHLANVYRLAHAEVPEYLKIPVLRQQAKLAFREPTAFITPVLDGVVTVFYEWQGAGYVEGRPPLSAMHSQGEYFSRIYFGFNLDQLSLRFDPAAAVADDVLDTPEVHVQFIEPRPAKLIFRLDLPEPPLLTLMHSQDGTSFGTARTYDSIRRKKVIELAVPFKDLGFGPGMQVRFVVRMMQGDLELERIPHERHVTFTVPDQTFEGAMWRA